MPKERRSFVWKYFVKDGDTCKCTKCPYTHKPKSSTTAAMSHHLRVMHKIQPDIEEDDGTDTAADTSSGADCSKEERDKQKVGLRHKLTQSL